MDGTEERVIELANRKTAREYYKDKNLQNLLNAVFRKYYGQNGVRGNAAIKIQSAEEAQRLQDYFGNRLERRIRPDIEIEISLKYFAEELEQGYKLTIPDLYEILHGVPLLTRADQKQLRESAWEDLFDKVNAKLQNLHSEFVEKSRILSEETFHWFERIKGGKAPGFMILKSAVNKDKEEANKALAYCMNALWYLLVDRETMLNEIASVNKKVEIPIFASYVTKRPHGFDWSELAGRLLWNALYDIDQQRIQLGRQNANGKLEVPEFMHRRQIYRNFGLLDDDISSFFHVFAHGFTTSRSLRTLNLREIEMMNPFPFYKSLYMIENPSVFSYLVDEIVNQFNMNDLSLEEIPKSFPALLCTSGRPRSATMMFVTKCLESNPGCTVHCSWDMDVAGVQMMHNMQEQFYARVEAWKMDAETYRSKHGDEQYVLLSPQDKKVLAKLSDRLSKVMVEVGIKVFQEEFARDLKNDMLQAIDREVLQD